MTAAERRKRSTHDAGRRAEAAALVLLVFRGYRILARRYRTPGGELDLVAMRGRTIAFVEVKARPDLETARTAIDEDKRRRVSNAARHWIGRRLGHDGWTGLAFRGDAVFVAPWRLPLHQTDAFHLDLEEFRPPSAQKRIV